MFYIVKTIHVKDNDCWNATSDAIFSKLQPALQCIGCNAGDLCEDGYNQWAVVIAAEEGVYPITTEIQWFVWDKYAKEYIRTIRPPFMDGWMLSI